MRNPNGINKTFPALGEDHTAEWVDAERHSDAMRRIQAEIIPSEFLHKMTRQEIHRIALVEQERQAWELVKAVEETLRQANDRWERITAELNALGGEVV